MSFRSSVWLSVVAALVAWGCGDSSDSSSGSTAGTGGSTAGSAGTTAGAGGSTAGAGGSTAGTGGSMAGASGSTAGAAGSSPGAECGNELIEGAEICDGQSLGGQSCASQGFESGTLACAASCDAFDTSACVGKPVLPGGVGVIGASGSEPYRCIGRGDATSFNWAEILAAKRGINFGGGVCQPFNHAKSGANVRDNMATQVQLVVADWNAKLIGKVIIHLGSNDFYANNETSAPVPQLLTIYDTGVSSLISAGMPAASIFITDVLVAPGAQPPAVTAFNTGLKNIATTRGAQFGSQTAYASELASRQVTGGYQVGGQIFTPTQGNEPHNLILQDGHLGTVANGLLANAMYVKFLGVSAMSDAEILSMAGL